MAQLSTIVSSFEVLLEQIDNKPGEQSSSPPTAAEIFHKSFQVPGLEDATVPFETPSAVQGYFLLISNLGRTEVKLRVAFNTSSPAGAQALAQRFNSNPPYAFLAITNTQVPTTSGAENISGIFFSGLVQSAQSAYIDLPALIPASGTYLFTLVPNYLNEGLVVSGAAGRGYVSLFASASGTVDLLLSPQIRTVFYSTTVSGTSEVAYGLPTAFGGGSRITSSG